MDYFPNIFFKNKNKKTNNNNIFPNIIDQMVELTNNMLEFIKYLRYG